MKRTDRKREAKRKKKQERREEGEARRNGVLEEEPEEVGEIRGEARFVGSGMSLASFVENATEIIKQLFPQGAGEDAEVKGTMQKAYEWSDYDYGLQEAVAWVTEQQDNPVTAAGRVRNGVYIPDEELIKRTVQEITKAGGLKEAAQERLDKLRSTRLNAGRVRRWVSKENPDRARIMDLASLEGGMPIMVPPDFKPNWDSQPQDVRRRTIDPRSKNAKLAEGPLARMVMEDFVLPGLAFCVPVEFAEGNIKGTHEVPPAWAKKHKKKKGRSCCHSSYTGGKGHSLNSEWLRTAARELWGQVEHVTIQEIAEMIEEAVRENGGTAEGLLLWKMDLQGAFQLLSFRTSDIQRTAMRITKELLVYFLCGTFGWGGTPMAFQVITRVLIWELRNNKSLGMRGWVTMYVDDLMGICKCREWEQVRTTVTALREGLLGTGAISTKKTESGRALDMIGYRVDLDTLRVGIAEHNVLKALHVSYCVDVDKPILVKALQAIAAHASRYKTVCPPIAPFARALHQAYRKCGQWQHKTTQISRDAKRAIWMVRVLLLLAHGKPELYTRPTVSLARRRPNAWEWVIEFDGSKTGLGIIWYQSDAATGKEVAIGGASVDITWMKLGAGEETFNYQNTVEFLAAVVGFRGLQVRGEANVTIKFRGDSKSALKWVRTTSFKSDLVGNASIAYVAMKWTNTYDVVETEHLAHGEDYDENWKCDMLSRGRALSEVIRKDDTLGERKLSNRMRDWSEDLAKYGRVQELLATCDPRVKLDEEGDFVTWWKRLHSILELH